MSQEGYLLVVKPSVIEKVCRSWPAEHQVPPDPDALSAKEAMERLKHAKPFSLERTWRVASSSGAKLIHIGYDRKRRGSSWHMDSSVFMYELDDDYFDAHASALGNFGRFASTVARHKAGLKVYWFLWSY